MVARLAWLVSVGCAAGGTLQSIPGAPMSDGGAPSLPIVPIETLPALQAATRALTISCVPADPAESPIAVDPEGPLWLSRGTQLTTLDVHGTRTPRPTLRSFERIGAAVARGGDLYFEADGHLWSLGESEMPIDAQASGVVSLCGDLEHVGALVVESQRLLQRAADGWWVIDAPDAGFVGLRAVAGRDGACTDEEDRVWVAAETGIWRAEAGATTLQRLDWPTGGPATLLASSLGAVVVGEGVVFHRAPADEEWSGLALEQRALVASAAGDNVWIAADGLLIRHRGVWEQAPTGRGMPRSVFAHAAGGAWLHFESELCHASFEAPIVVDGVRPYGRRLETTGDIEVRASSASLVRLSVDGALVAESASEMLAASDVALGELGWHVLSVEAQRGATMERRDVTYFVEPGDVSFATDIAPIYAGHCARCHMDTYDTADEWRASTLILGRVVRSEMPLEPGPDWGPAQKALIQAWYEGGMRP